MQNSHPMLALQLCLVAALAAFVHSDCSLPNSLSFAVLRNINININQRYPIGTELTYRCMPGYEPVPGTRPVIKCLETSEWSEVPQFCQGRHCPFPDIENGRIATMTDLRLGDQITFACIEGYRLIGGNAVRCVLQAGRVVWNQSLPHCQRIPCFPPPTIANSKHDGAERDSYEYGSAVTYICESGFSLIGGTTIICTVDENGINGKWSGSIPRCEVVECRRPEILNGRIISSYQSSYTYGNTVMFECYHGYILQGENVIRCEANNTWHPAPPICALRDCDPPKPISFAVLTDEQRESYPVGTILTYHCIPGYEYIPGLNPSIECLKTSEWSKTRQFCRKRWCPYPFIRNGKIAPPISRWFDSEITFECNKGYRLIGENTARCVLEDGGGVTWNRDPPLCEVVNCGRPEVSNGITYPHRTSYTYGNTVQFQCKAGYMLQGSQSSTCEVDSTWHPAPPTCVSSGCDPPTGLYFAELLDAYKNKTYYPVGSIVKYKCQPGYTKQPKLPYSIECLGSRKWSSGHICERRQCPSPNIENGRIGNESGFQLGDKITFQCDKGHRLIGQDTARCVLLKNNTVDWDMDSPHCERIPCYPPPDIPHGKHTGRYEQDFYYGSAVTYTCDEGYPLIGKASIYCTTKDGENGVWSGHVSCGVTPCPAPKVENGRIVAGDSGRYSYGHKVTVGCNGGYRLTGSREISCQADGTWDPPVPRCEQNGTLLPTSGSSFSPLSGTQAPPVTAPTYTSSLPTFQTQLAWKKLFIILQEIKDTVNIKTKSVEERLNELEKKVDNVISKVQSCQQAKEERLGEEEDSPVRKPHRIE